MNKSTKVLHGRGRDLSWGYGVAAGNVERSTTFSHHPPLYGLVLDFRCPQVLCTVFWRLASAPKSRRKSPVYLSRKMATVPSLTFRPPTKTRYVESLSCTVGQINQEYKVLGHSLVRSPVCSFARTAHSFACSGLLASLAPSAALSRSLARSLPRSWLFILCFFRCSAKA